MSRDSNIYLSYEELSEFFKKSENSEIVVEKQQFKKPFVTHLQAFPQESKFTYIKNDSKVKSFQKSPVTQCIMFINFFSAKDEERLTTDAKVNAQAFQEEIKILNQQIIKKDLLISESSNLINELKELLQQSKQKIALLELNNEKLIQENKDFRDKLQMFSIKNQKQQKQIDEFKAGQKKLLQEYQDQETQLVLAQKTVKDQEKKINDFSKDITKQKAVISERQAKSLGQKSKDHETSNHTQKTRPSSKEKQQEENIQQNIYLMRYRSGSSPREQGKHQNDLKLMSQTSSNWFTQNQSPKQHIIQNYPPQQNTLNQKSYVENLAQPNIQKNQSIYGQPQIIKPRMPSPNPQDRCSPRTNEFSIHKFQQQSQVITQPKQYFPQRLGSISIRPYSEEDFPNARAQKIFTSNNLIKISQKASPAHFINSKKQNN